jgi:hypothetical protein
MPYGIKNETPEQTKWMERCVSGIKGTNKRTGKPYTEGDKIAICKAQLKKTGASEEALSEESLRELENKLDRALSPGGVERPTSPSPYLVDVYDDYVIVSKNEKYYKLGYTMEGDDVSFSWESAIEVERKTTYEPVSAEREIVTKVPDVKSDNKISGGRVITIGGRTVN